MPFRFPSFPASFRALLPLAPIAALASAGSIACTSTTTTTTTTTDDSLGYSAALLLRPAAFIGDTPCGSATGSMRSYVATLIDHVQVTDDATGEEKEQRFTFPSSLPVPCGQGVRFDNIVGGHFYSVQLDGYEKLATDIGPQGWANANGTVNYGKQGLGSGSRHMENKVGLPVTPRWAGSCGEGDQDQIVAAASGTTLILGCDPLEDLNPAKGVTAVEIDPRGALGTLACEGEGTAGQPTVATFDVASEDGLGDTAGLPCSKDTEPVTITGAGLVPGAVVNFYVAAHATKDGPLAWGAMCTAIVEEGITVHATCAPLTAEGALRIDFAEILAPYSLVCGADFATYDAVLSAGGESFVDKDLACDKPKVYKPVQPGDYQADLSVQAKNGTTVFAVTCAGSIDPGRTTTVTSCTQQ